MKPECDAHIWTKPALRHAELLSLGLRPQMQRLNTLVVLALELPPKNQAADSRLRGERFSLSLLPALSLIHEDRQKGRTSTRRNTGPAFGGARDTEETRKNDEQKIQERPEIKINVDRRR
jgi:hypothetical protein